MKWITLTGLIFLISACCCTSANRIESRQVMVAAIAEPVVVGYPNYSVGYPSYVVGYPDYIVGYPDYSNMTETTVDFF